MSVNISQLRDQVNLVRATELKKGSWLSLSADLPDYPLYTALLQRVVQKTAFEIKWTVSQDEDGDVTDDSDFYVGVGTPLQTHTSPMTRRCSIDLAKVRQATAYAEDEPELQGTAEEELAPIVVMRKAEKLDLPLLSKMEHKLADTPSSSSTPFQELYGLKYWFPHDSAATDLELNGGGDPTNFSSGAADLTVADAEFWAHAVAGFDKVSDDDLFDKLTEFHIRVNSFVPEGVRSLDSTVPNRCILCQHPVFIEWSRLQQIANDNPGRDLGIWRNAIWYGSVPVKWLPVISEPNSAQTPSGFGLLYDLDLNTLRLQIHSRFNFDLEMGTTPDEPKVVKMWREGYAQLACINRRKNATFYTAAADLISKA